MSLSTRLDVGGFVAALAAALCVVILIVTQLYQAIHLFITNDQTLYVWFKLIVTSLLVILPAVYVSAGYFNSFDRFKYAGVAAAVLVGGTFLSIEVYEACIDEYSTFQAWLRLTILAVFLISTIIMLWYWRLSYKSVAIEFRAESRWLSVEMGWRDLSIEMGGLISKLQERVLDINLVAERFAPGEVATLTVAVLLPTSKLRGRWQSVIEVQEAPALISVEVRGFEVVSEAPGPIALRPDRDSPLVAFQLLIVESSERWIHVIISQGGAVTGECVVNDFSAFQEGVRIASRSALRAVETADLTLEIRAVDRKIVAYSPAERASLYGTVLGELRYLPDDARTRLRQRLKSLYKATSDASKTERELKLIGVDLAKCLPADLTVLLRRTDIKTVMLRHEDECDFPFELVYLDDKTAQFFVGDRIAICRWYLGVQCPPSVIDKKIRKVAVLVGKTNASSVDRAMLEKMFPSMATVIERYADVINLVFKSREFDIIHFTGHCSVDEAGRGGLQLADSSFLSLREIGQLEEERRFSEAQPFVMLNACASGQPYAALIERDSFAHRFVTNRACAFVGTLWPVDGRVANDFARCFYAHLSGGKTIANALLATKSELVGLAGEELTTGLSDVQKLATRVAVRSYCVFANPDLRLVLPSMGEKS